MNDFKVLKSVSELENFDWDKRTCKLLVPRGGAGNMFGGHSSGEVYTVHGENSISQTGLVESIGTYKAVYNIARGANGPSSGSISYMPFKGDAVVINTNQANDCTGLLCVLIGAKKAWIKE